MMVTDELEEASRIAHEVPKSEGWSSATIVAADQM